MQKKKHRFAGKGYYIALIACVAAVGISGYVFVRTAQNSAVETMAAPAAVESRTPEPSAASVTPKASKTTAAPTASDEREEKQKSRTTDRMEDAYEEAMAPASIPRIVWPVQGAVAATFSRDTLTYSRTMADWRTHEGLDISADSGAPVSAAQEGTVTAVYEDDYLGNVVVISHSGDLATLYANLAPEPAVAVGDKVLAGEVLGQVGTSALLEAVEPAHLHFEVYESGAPVDPLEYLPG